MNKLRKVNSPCVTASANEQYYWAARALRAETLLSSKAEHYNELRQLSYREKMDRQRELTALGKVNEARIMHLEKKLERLLVSLGNQCRLDFNFADARCCPRSVARWGRHRCTGALTQEP